LLYVGPGKDDLGGYTRDDVIDAVHHHRAIATNGPFLDMAIGDHGIGDTISVPDGMVDVAIHVRAPTWAKVDHLVVYANSEVVADQTIPAARGTDYETQVHLTLTRDSWVVAEATGAGNMFPVVSAIEFPPLDATVIIQALSVGLDLSSLPLTSNLKPSHVHISTPYAITNPIWIDVGAAGWTSPRSPLSRTAAVAPPGPAPDVRARFDALPEISR
jgi:hypothetical protein